MSDTALQKRYSLLLPHLNERHRRLLAAADARALGYGGITKIHQITGMSRSRIHKGLYELEAEPLSEDRCRQIGGGRKKAEYEQPGLKSELNKLIDPDTRGDPESPLRWTSKSTIELSKVLKAKGFQVSSTTVGRLLKELGYSLQAAAKTREGTTHDDRDKQFSYINRKSKQFLDAENPVLSVDTKKKELVGNYRNNGREWQKKRQPVEVNMHDFPDKTLGKAIPYGVYDIQGNRGWVNVGITKDTSQFAVESIRRWWRYLGKKRYPKSKRLLITADSGGSNGYRVKLWKKELQLFSNQTGLEITICHFPPGTSKWNKIEHRLFSYISMNWRGRPLTSLRLIINLIGSTKTQAGLRVHAMIDSNQYQTGIKVSNEEMKLINLIRHKFRGDWNYTIKPNSLKR